MIDWFRQMFGGTSSQPNAPTLSPAPLYQQAYRIFDLLAARQIIEDDLAAALRQWGMRPVRLVLGIQGQPTMTTTTVQNVNDVSFVIEVRGAFDAAGRSVPDVGPFDWTADPAEAVSSIDEDTAQAGNTAFRTVHVAAPDADGNQADFTITATGPSGETGSLACHPIAGGPTRLVLGVG